MSIVTLKKITLCGLLREKPLVLDELRDLRCLHLVTLVDPKVGSVDGSEPPEDVVKALRYLRDCPRKRRQVSAAREFDAADIAREALRNQAETRRWSDRRDFLQHRIRELNPWGNFTLPDELSSRGFKFWFFIVPAGLQHRLPREGWVWQVVHRERGQLYIVVIAENEPPASAMPVPRTHTGSIPLAELEAELDQVCLTLEDLEAERESLTRWIRMMEETLAAVEDESVFRQALRCTADEPPLFGVEAWAPADDVPRLRNYAESRRLALSIADPAPDDRPPTLLANSPVVQAGQNLVAFYQVPQYGTWDPSAPVLFSFAWFFAIILSDAGYGLALGLLVLIFWRSFGVGAGGDTVRRLAILLTGFAMFWGVLAGSYFGWSPPPDSLAGRLRLVAVDDFDAMMRLTVLIGVLHLSAANLSRAWQLRSRTTALPPLGWAAVMGGGYILWLAGNSPEWTIAGRSLVAAGAGLILLFAGAAPLRGVRDWLRRLAEGLLEIVANTSKAFGDVLSYLRLFALGLAGSSLAETFNALAGSASRTLAGAGLFAAVLILIIGHSLNLALGLMGGVVHGLRLNFIEFYSWGLKGEGYAFRPFRKKEIPR